VEAVGSKRIEHLTVSLMVGCALFFSAALIGYAGASDPGVFLVTSGLICLPFLLYAAYLKPNAALALCFTLLLIATTKFRGRTATATLVGELDAQVRFEIAMFAIIGVILLLALLKRSDLISDLRTTELILLGYVGLALASVLWSPAAKFTLVRALQLALLYGVAVTSHRLLPTERLLRALTAAMLSYVLICAGLSAAFPWAGGGFGIQVGVRRFSWFSVHPITAATMVGLCFVLLLSLALFGTRRWRERCLGLPVWVPLIPLSGLIAATNSRGPTAALLAGIGALLVRKHLRVWTVLLLGASVVAMLVFFASTGETLADVIAQAAKTDPLVAQLLLRGQSVRDLESFSGRTQLWEAAWPLLLDRPILGFGFQGSRAALLAATPWAAYAHNALLQTLLDLGLLGAVLLWGTFAYTLVVTVRPLRDAFVVLEWAQATAFALTVFLMVNSVSSESFTGNPGIEWLLLLIAVSVGQHSRSRMAHRGGMAITKSTYHLAR
jgi:O-antigen ligase